MEQSTRSQRTASKTKHTTVGITRPRRHKKLLVLDIDDTLYGYTRIQRLAPRPHLQEFLTGVYPHYDLALWSATRMEYIERKVKKMKIENKISYKFLFYLDKSDMTTVDTLDMGEIETKPLTTIYERFPQFNEKNTLICDDQPENFYCNPRNGLEVSEYSVDNRKTDKELLLLKKYLIRIAKEPDLSKLEHGRWRETVE